MEPDAVREALCVSEFLAGGGSNPFADVSTITGTSRSSAIAATVSGHPLVRMTRPTKSTPATAVLRLLRPARAAERPERRATVSLRISSPLDA